MAIHCLTNYAWWICFFVLLIFIGHVTLGSRSKCDSYHGGDDDKWPFLSQKDKFLDNWSLYFAKQGK